MNGDAEREKRFEALDRFRASLPDYDEDEVVADVADAVEAVRRERCVERTEAAEPEQAPPPPPVQRAEVEEMGGEAPCQLHRVWDPEEE